MNGQGILKGIRRSIKSIHRLERWQPNAVLRSVSEAHMESNLHNVFVQRTLYSTRIWPF